MKHILPRAFIMALHEPAGLRQDIHTDPPRAAALICSTWKFRHVTQVGISVADVSLSTCEAGSVVQDATNEVAGGFARFSPAGADSDYEHLASV